LGLKEGESEERLTRLAWLLQERKRSTPPACFPVKNTTTKWPEVVMSFGGGWFGLGPKKGGVVPFRIYSRRFQKLHRDNDRDREGFCKHFLKLVFLIQSNISNFANIKVLVLI
jgi:hypothetical protein